MDEKDEIKVNDKRRFNEDGESSQVEAEPKVEESPQPESFSGSAETMNFSSFLIGLATQAMVMMGEVPHPETGQSTENLEAAKQTIDVLGLLEEKTAGNLTETEQKLLAEILASVRMAYVSKKKG